MVMGAGKREIRGPRLARGRDRGLQQRVQDVRVRVTSGIDVQGSLCRFTGVVRGPLGQLPFTLAGAALPSADVTHYRIVIAARRMSLETGEINLPKVADKRHAR
jgi:hypothetical protein